MSDTSPDTSPSQPKILSEPGFFDFIGVSPGGGSIAGYQSRGERFLGLEKHRKNPDPLRILNCHVNNFRRLWCARQMPRIFEY